MNETPVKRGRGRPPKPEGQTPKRYLRMGPLWEEAVAMAAGREETVTALVTRAVERELQRLKRQNKTGQ